MKYDRDKETVRNILKTADIANTFNGGMSQPLVNFARKEDHYLINVRTPGVNVNSLRVEIINKFVSISHSLQFHYDNAGVDIPHVVATIPISLDVDYKNIRATEQNGALQIIMPFSELAGGYRKRVEINR